MPSQYSPSRLLFALALMSLGTSSAPPLLEAPPPPPLLTPPPGTPVLINLFHLYMGVLRQSPSPFEPHMLGLSSCSGSGDVVEALLVRHERAAAAELTRKMDALGQTLRLLVRRSSLFHSSTSSSSDSASSSSSSSSAFRPGAKCLPSSNHSFFLTLTLSLSLFRFRCLGLLFFSSRHRRPAELCVFCQRRSNQIRGFGPLLGILAKSVRNSQPRLHLHLFSGLQSR